MKGSKIETLKTPYRTSKANAICKRFLGRARREFLDHLLIMMESHLYWVIKARLCPFSQLRKV